MDASASAVEDLKVFKRAYRISLAVHRCSLGLPAVEQRARADQVRAREQVDLRQPGRGVCPARAEPGGLPSLHPDGHGIGR
jgi:hypothetical protein